MEPLVLRSFALFLLLLNLLMQTPTSSQSLNTTDGLALLSFRSLASKGNALDSWNDSVGFCMWHGVICGSRRQPNGVTNLTLESLGLDGTISPSLSNLTYLTHLHLAGSNLGGSIPQELGRLQQLQYLNLSSNSLQGEIPANLSRCSNLEVLFLRDNKLIGTIPAELGSLKNLQVLKLRENNVTGTIPASIGNLSSLVELRLAFNSLGGSIPAELGRISTLELLDLWTNQLTGNIPRTLSNLSSLYGLSVGTNNLSGELPMDFGRGLPELMYLHLFRNSFEGPFPSYIANSSKLLKIVVSNNRFSGLVPPVFGTLTSLSVFQISDNKFEASTPDEWSFVTSLTNCTELQIFGLSKNLFQESLPGSVSKLSKKLTRLKLRENKITGRIPSNIGDLSSLSALDMEWNRLSGPIPYSFGKLKNLQALLLRGNRLSGILPSSIGSLTGMLELLLSENRLTGPVPDSFAALEKLTMLELSHNNLSGTLPKGVLGISSISIYLNLSHNSFVGPLPEEVGNLINLKALDVSQNRFSSIIPVSLGKCQLLEYLNLQSNNFVGTVLNLDGLMGIEYLDLSNNHLSGPIPEFLGNLPFLRELDLSFNDFSGLMPTNGFFGDLTFSSIQGNEELCGGNYNLNLRSCPETQTHKLSSAVIAIIVISISLCSSFLFYLVFRFLSKRKSRKLPLFHPSEDDHFFKISYYELFKATNGFTSANRIGSGGFGVVYKGFLDHARINVAVEVLNQQLHAASKSFLAECKMLRNIRHRNLLTIKTCCSTLDSSGNEFRALVYEFIPNGSLERWLHADEHGNNLNFLQRLNIAIDVASALDYLHNQINTPIVHCDLKPSNVLIDYDMTAYVGDFGIARILSSNTETSTIGINGTVGYIAPGTGFQIQLTAKCGVGSRVSTSWDVYSYGILLLEMFTGKRPTDESFGDGFSLRKYVEASFPDQILDIIDPQLLSLEKDNKVRERIRVSFSISNEDGSYMHKGIARAKDAYARCFRHFGLIKDTFLEVEGDGMI